MDMSWSSDPDFMLTPWNQLQTRLKPETVVRHWGGTRHFTGKAFTVIAIHPSHLELVIHSGGERKLTRHEFEKVEKKWSEYRAGVVSRQSISSENTTYIFSLLKWLEDTLEAANV